MTQDARDTEKSKSLIMNNHGNEKEVSNSAKVAHSKRSRSSRCPLQHVGLPSSLLIRVNTLPSGCYLELL